MSTITQEAQATAAGLREAALCAGGALTVRLNQAAALLEQLAPTEPDDEPLSLADRISELRVNKGFQLQALAELLHRTVGPDDDYPMSSTLKLLADGIDHMNSELEEFSDEAAKLEAAGGAQ